MRVVCATFGTQAGSSGNEEPQALRHTLSRLPSKSLGDQQPPGQLVCTLTFFLCSVFNTQTCAVMSRLPLRRMPAICTSVPVWC